MKPALILATVLALAACDEDEALPVPLVMTDEALGHYCQMYLADHAGPKAQVFLDGYDLPLWFSQVSDAAAFRGDAEKMAPITVIYVSDMAAGTWAEPGAANWIDATTARFVIESQQTGGMGLPEAIPFGTEAAAIAFAADHGGRVVAWADVPDQLGRTLASDGPLHAPNEHHVGHGAAHGEALQ